MTNDHRSSSGSSSASDSGVSTSRTSLSVPMHKPLSPPRRIRFAPLLDPRRAVVVTDDGHELPIKDDTHFPAATSLAVLQNHNSASQTQKQAVTACSDPDPPPEQSTSGSPSSSSAFSSPTDAQISSSSSLHSPRPQSRSFTVNILKPFKRPPSPDNSKTRTSKSLSITPGEILTLGTSKENNDPSSPLPSPLNSLVGGWALSRRRPNPSSPNNNPQTTEILGNNPPLTRSQSVQESTDRKKKRSSITTFFSSAPGVSSLVDLKPKTKRQTAKIKTGRTIPTASSSPSISATSPPASESTITNGRSALSSRLPAPQRTARHKSYRMLNGRVYGAQRNNHLPENPFANAPDDEPEFVEWGYGGMGSVRGARSAGVVGNSTPGSVNWERLLGGSEVSDQGGWSVPGGGRGGAGARMKKSSVETEGSLERRSGEGLEGAVDAEEDDGSGLAWIRKRRRMREEKEKRMKENEQSHENSQGSESLPTSPSAMDSQVTDSATQTTIKVNGSRNGVDEHRQNESHHDHVMKAVSVPMPPRQPAYHKKQSSRCIPEGAENGTTVDTTNDNDHKKLEDISLRELQTRPANSGSTSSGSSESDSSEDESGSDGEDSSEEEEDEDEKRKTAIGAGVEKVTASFRHRAE